MTIETPPHKTPVLLSEEEQINIIASSFFSSFLTTEIHLEKTINIFSEILLIGEYVPVFFISDFINYLNNSKFKYSDKILDERNNSLDELYKKHFTSDESLKKIRNILLSFENEKGFNTLLAYAVYVAWEKFNKVKDEELIFDTEIKNKKSEIYNYFVFSSDLTESNLKLKYSLEKNGDFFNEEDVWDIQNFFVFPLTSERIAIRQVTGLASKFESYDSDFVRKVREIEKNAMSILNEIGDSSIGGFDGVDFKGSIQNLLASEIVYDYVPIEGLGNITVFDQKFHSNQLLFLKKDESPREEIEKVFSIVISPFKSRKKIVGNLTHQTAILQNAISMRFIKDVFDIIDSSCLRIKILWKTFNEEDKVSAEEEIKIFKIRYSHLIAQGKVVVDLYSKEQDNCIFYDETLNQESSNVMNISSINEKWKIKDEEFNPLSPRPIINKMIVFFVKNSFDTKIQSLLKKGKKASS